MVNARWVDCSVVADIVKGPLASETTIVDVRDEDFVGGQIKGAINVASAQFTNDAAIDALIDSHLQDKSRVIMHCMFSQQRGPRCAARLAQRLQERGRQQPAVLVMTGGFERFNRLYGTNPALVIIPQPWIERCAILPH